MIRWQDELGADDRSTDATVDCGPAWQLASARLRGQVGRAAVLSPDARRGADVLRAAGIDAMAIGPDAPGERSLTAFDAIVLVDALGTQADDVAFMRSLARRSVAGTRLVVAVVRAEVGQQLEAPRRRAYGAKAVDALLVRSGWTSPRFVGRTSRLFIVECQRIEDLRGVDTLALAESVADASDADDVIGKLARVAQGTQEQAEAREVFLTMGALRRARGETEAAEQAYTAANEISPECPRPLIALAELAASRGAVDDAEAMFDHALALDATSVAAWVGLAAIFESRGESARAIESLECAASLAPADAELAMNLSRRIAACGDKAGAIASLERVLPYGDAPSALRASYTWLVASAATQGVDAPRLPARGSVAVVSHARSLMS